MLILERPWTRQPPAGTPASKKWLRVYGQYGFDAANRGARLSPGTQLFRPGLAGIGLHVNANGQVTTNELISGISSEMTFVFIAEKFATISTNSDFLLGEHEASGGDYNFGFYEGYSTGGLNFYIHNGSAGAAASSLAWTVNSGPQIWVATYGGGDNNVRLYLNGAQVGSAAQTGNIRRYSSCRFRSCFWNGGVPNFNLYAAAVSNKNIGASEVRANFSTLASAYDSLFAPSRIPIPTPAAAGYTHPTLSLATATEITATTAKPRVTYTFA